MVSLDFSTATDKQLREEYEKNFSNVILFGNSQIINGVERTVGKNHLERTIYNCWESYLRELTPVEKIGGMWFKREDKFSPNGVGSINGSKLRQLIHLISGAYAKGATGILSGSVTGSPQHLMTAIVAAHYGLPCTLVCNTHNIEKYPMLNLAKKYGVTFEYSKVGYAKTLESKAFQLQKTEKYKNYFVIEMNITASEKLNTSKTIREFHEIGAWQVRNIPQTVHTLIIPCGSCNSVTSILYGLYLHKINWVKNVVLCGIGNTGSKDISYINKRLGIIDTEAKDYFENNINVDYYNLNGEGFCKYEDLMPFNYHGLELHPRYEGKIFNYFLAKGLQHLYNKDNTMFWVVGSEPKF
jgi:1-aminocyclopropane-1-carboxylate deaminase/D-cysteine desulfhydrase-like pyridoxal-dependent ACC family enzyme